MDCDHGLYEILSQQLLNKGSETDNEILVLITYALNYYLNLHVQLSSGAKGLTFDPVFIYRASSEGSDKTMHLGRHLRLCNSHIQ